MTFKNIKEIDAVIIGTINEARKQFVSGKNIIKLFENKQFDFEPKNQIDIDDFYGNKLAYLKNVKTLFESNRKEFKKSQLFEEAKPFFDELETEIEYLLSLNDFKQLRRLNPLILKTKLFANQEINVFGFNILNFNKILEQNNIKGAFAVVYDLTNHKLLFLIDSSNDYFSYDIQSGKIEQLKFEIKILKNDVNKILKRNGINNYVFLTQVPYEIEINNKTNDNLFRDFNLKAIRAMQIEKQKRKQIIF